MSAKPFCFETELFGDDFLHALLDSLIPSDGFIALIYFVFVCLRDKSGGGTVERSIGNLRVGYIAVVVDS